MLIRTGLCPAGVCVCKKLLQRQTAVASGTKKGHTFLKICAKTCFFCVRFWGPIGLIQCISGPNLAATMWTLFLPRLAAGVRILGETRMEKRCPLDSTMRVLFCSPQKHVARLDLGLGLGQKGEWYVLPQTRKLRALWHNPKRSGLPLCLIRSDNFSWHKGAQLQVPSPSPSAQPLQLIFPLNTSRQASASHLVQDYAAHGCNSFFHIL